MKILAVGGDNHLVMDFGRGLHDMMFLKMTHGDIWAGKRLVIDARVGGEVRAWTEIDGRPVVLASPARDVLRDLPDERLAAVLRLVRGRRVRRSTFEAIRDEVMERVARRSKFRALYDEVMA